MKPNLKLVSSRPSERVFGSAGFIAIGRNPMLQSPARFEPTVKAAGDVIL